MYMCVHVASVCVCINVFIYMYIDILNTEISVAIALYIVSTHDNIYVSEFLKLVTVFSSVVYI